MPIKIPLLIVRRNPVQRITHISAHIFVPILVQRQCAGGMLNEKIEEAAFVVADFGEFVDDGVGDEVAAARAGGEGELFLEPGHFRFFLLGCVWLWVGVLGLRKDKVLRLVELF